MGKNSLNKKKFFWWLATVLWSIFIFWNSSKSGSESSQISMEFLVVIKETILNIFGNDIALTELIIRKLAHVTEYAILAFLMANSWKYTLINNLSTKKVYMLTFLISVTYAASDELHQHFVPGRACSIIDVLIDSIGVVLGIGLFITPRLKIKSFDCRKI